MTTSEIELDQNVDTPPPVDVPEPDDTDFSVKIVKLNSGDTLIGTFDSEDLDMMSHPLRYMSGVDEEDDSIVIKLIPYIVGSRDNILYINPDSITWVSEVTDDMEELYVRCSFEYFESTELMSDAEVKMEESIEAELDQEELIDQNVEYSEPLKPKEPVQKSSKSKRVLN